MENIIKVGFNEKLNDKDTENMTYGCRQKNPDICKYNGLSGICAFVREDHLCLKPSRAWKNQYNKLKNNS